MYRLLQHFLHNDSFLFLSLVTLCTYNSILSSSVFCHFTVRTLCDCAGCAALSLPCVPSLCQLPHWLVLAAQVPNILSVSRLFSRSFNVAYLIFSTILSTVTLSRMSRCSFVFYLVHSVTNLKVITSVLSLLVSFPCLCPTAVSLHLI
jgi:hypothetical protein